MTSEYLMDQQQKGQLSHVLEHTWFFGNTLLNKSKSTKTMVRSNSDPSPASSNTPKDDVTFNSSPHYHSIKMNNNLRRAPSLPISLGKDKKYELVEEEEEEEEDEPRMGDLIRQAMPMPPLPTPRLERRSSLPPCRVANEASSIIVSNVEKGENLCRKMSTLLQEKAPMAKTKLTRTASIDSSLLLPPKCNSKGTKQNPSYSKNKTPRKREPTKMNNNPTKIDQSNIQPIDNNIKSQKSLSALQIQELQGFKDLGFSTDNNDLSSCVTQIHPGRLQRKASLDSTVMRPYFSDPPPVPDWVDPKATSTQDMKAQIKFWARAVASNMQQEC